MAGKDRENQIIQITLPAIGGVKDVTSAFVTNDSKVFMAINGGVYAFEFGVINYNY